MSGFTLIVAMATVAAVSGPSPVAVDAAGYHPYIQRPSGPRTVDLGVEASVPAPGFPGRLPGGLVQQGSVVVPAAVASGEVAIDPRPFAAVEDIPGNEYPRKHTVFLNFTGGMLYVGTDNSAEDRSSLARQGMYPAFTGGQAQAVSAVQAFGNDVAPFGIRVLYLERPSKTVPYTMVMIGGSWTDTNLEDPAAGVSGALDCGALGQRHVVYTFADGSWSATAIANVSSQEAGHAWGLDHSVNCGSVMSYCGGGDKVFSSTCDGLCEEACQGPAGCRLTHEMFCGEDSDEQNEVAELSWIFGGPEPDLEPPTVEIVAPEDGAVLEVGSDVDLRAIVDDDFGGYGWRFIIERDGEVVYDQVDYDKDVDAEYRAALNFINLETGTYVMTVEVEDHADNVSVDSVTITVEGPAGDTDDSNGSTGTIEGSTGDESGTSTSGTTTAPPDPPDPDPPDTDPADTETTGPVSIDGDGGCGCQTSAPPRPALAFFLLVLVTGARRRRSDS